MLYIYIYTYLVIGAVFAINRISYPLFVRACTVPHGHTSIASTRCLAMSDSHAVGTSGGARDMNRVCATTESQPLCAESTSLAGGRGEQSRRAGVGAPRRGQTESEGKTIPAIEQQKQSMRCLQFPTHYQ